jgi:hypothetical protein
MALTAYNNATRLILRDANAKFWSDPELNTYINEARLAVVRDTACTRLLLPNLSLTTKVGNFPFSTISNFAITAYSVAGTTLTVTTAAHSFSTGFQVAISGVTTPAAMNGTWGLLSAVSGATTFTIALTAAQAAAMTGAYAGAGIVNLSILDVMDIYAIYNGVRYALDRLSYSQLARVLLFYKSLNAPPAAFAVYGQSVMIAPLPDQTYQSEWDVVPYPAALIDDTTFEPIPLVYQPPIRFYAAYLAYLGEQQYDKANNLLNQYKLQATMASKSQLQRGLRHGTFR